MWLLRLSADCRNISILWIPVAKESRVGVREVESRVRRSDIDNMEVSISGLELVVFEEASLGRDSELPRMFKIDA